MMDVPYDVDIERSALGSLLIDPALMAEAEAALRPEDFYRDAHGMIYGAMLELWRSGSALDYTLLCGALEEQGALEAVGGAAYVVLLIEGTPTSAHFSSYAREVLALANRRRLMSAGIELQNMAREGGCGVPELVEQAQGLLSAVSARAGAHGAAVPFESALEAYWGDLRSELSGSVARVPFGFRDLDALIGGLKAGDLCYIGASPSMGKTTLCLQAALNLALLGVGPTVVFSVESTEAELAGRILGYVTGVTSDAIRKGHVVGDTLPWLGLVASELQIPILLREDYDLSPAGIDAALMRVSPKARLVVVDHVQRMEGGRRFKDRREEVTYISRRLKSLAQKHEVPVIAVCTLSRAVESRKPPRPMLADLKETGDLEYDADVAILLYWAGRYDPESPMQFVTEAIVAKHRDGPCGVAYLRRGGQGQLSDLVHRNDSVTL